MSNYYEFREAKVLISHALGAKGWKIYGYKADDSDSMTDYYSPAYWDGIATKNGYVLVVDNSTARNSGYEQKKYNYNGSYQVNAEIQGKINKLENMTTDRGASEQEEQTAKEKIDLLLAKQQPTTDKYIIVDTYPTYQANPPHMKWHIEKDGIILAKGTGISKYSDLDRYHPSEDKATLESIREGLRQYYDDTEVLERCSISSFQGVEDKRKLYKTFNDFINKIDTTAGAILGEGEAVVYEKVIITEYRTENKAVVTEQGTIKEDQCIILNTGFTGQSFKGYVYRIKKTSYGSWHGVKLNGKLTKECTGSASSGNRFNFGSLEALQKWIDKGSISFCNIEEVKTPYQVEKCIKKVLKVETEEQPKKEKKTATTTTREEQPTTAETNNLTYDIKEDTDTRDNSKIYVVKVVEKLSREEYLKVNQYMNSLNSYYSKFKHGFVFKDDPTELLNSNIKQEETNTKSEQPQSNLEEQTAQKQPQAEAKKPIDFEIEQSEHTKTKKSIWLVKVKSNLSKDDFAEVKRNFATLKGFYSSFNNSFIFNYDPSEKLKISA